MKDFMEIVEQVQAKNREQRQMLARSLSPFFDALQQGAAYEEEYQRTLKRDEDKAMRFNKSLQELATKQGVDISGISPTSDQASKRPPLTWR